MYRRVVSWLLVPVVLLAQWANAGQCRGCAHSAEHNHAPHTHLGFPTGENSHADADDDCDDGLPPSHPEPAERHRGDMLPLPVSLSLGWQNGQASAELDQPGGLPLFTQTPPILVAAGTCFQRERPPFPPSPNRPVYLRTLSLLL